MINDKNLELSLLQAGTADAVSTNTYDLGAAARQIGTGVPLCVALIVTTAADHTTGDEVYAFEIVESAAADLGTPTVLVRRVLLYSQLTLGAIIQLPLPAGTPILRYLGINYDGGGTTPTITFSAYLMPSSAFEPSPKVHYPSGFAVL